MGSTSQLLVDAEYLGLGCETLGLEIWMPGVWREAWAGGRQLGVGGWDRKWGPGRRGPGESQAGEGVIFSGDCCFLGRKLRTHMFPATNSHMCVHMHRACVSMDGRDWGLRLFRCGVPIPSPGLPAHCPFCERSPTLLSPIPCRFSRFEGPQFLWPALL